MIDIDDRRVIVDMAIHMEREMKVTMQRITATMDQRKPDMMAMATILAVQMVEQGLRKVLCADAAGAVLYEAARGIIGAITDAKPNAADGIRDFDGKVA